MHCGDWNKKKKTAAPADVDDTGCTLQNHITTLSNI